MSIELDELWEQYSLDSNEALRGIEENLLILEGSPREIEQVHALYRNLHSLKGNSAIVQLAVISGLAHVAEDMVGVVRDRGVAVDQSLIDLMLELVDRLRDLIVTAVRDRVDATEDSVSSLFRRAREWIWAHEGGARSLAPAPQEELEIWSEPPPPSRAGDPDTSPTEIFLALAREGVQTLRALVKASAERPLDAAAIEQIKSTGADLGRAAERLLLPAVVRAVGELSTWAGASAVQLGQAFVSLCAALADVERSLKARIGVDFGLADAHRDARTWLEGLQQKAAPGAGPAGEPRAAGTRASKGAPAGASTTDFLRVDARKVAAVMDLAGEIGQACALVTNHPDLAGQDLEGFSAAAHQLDVLIRELQNEVSAMRLVPVAGVFQAMKRVVRDAARRTGKTIELELLGEETEIDKVMVDQLHDPLVHLVRNAIDHGVEAPDVRERLGKRPAGRIVLEASHQAGEIAVQISDDGAGLDRDRILSRAKERGLVPADAVLDDEQIAELIFLPGFSTKEKVDEISGRGVGMDLVKKTIESMRGRVQLRSVAGRGSRVTISVPLTLAFVEAMIIRERGRLFALPVEKVFEVLKVDRAQIARSSAAATTTIRIRDKLVPIVWLHEYYGELVANDRGLDGRVVVVVQTSSGNIGLPVDALLGNEHVMLKPLNGVLAGVRAAAGCGMLRSGDVALALDCERLA